MREVEWALQLKLVFVQRIEKVSLACAAVKTGDFYSSRA
jgi:hypothetical protein